MRRAPYEALCTGHGRRAVFGPQSTLVDTGASGWIAATTAAGPQAISAAVADLLDIATVVYRSERQLPKRGAANPNVRYELVVPVSDPDAWRGQSQELLEELLGFLGMAEWTVQFVRRPARARQYFKSEPVERPVSRIALLSGGLDSTSGVGAGLAAASNTQLCAFYTRQASLQAGIAASLGFPTPTQWWMQNAAGRGRAFFYRSFLFLALAAVTGETFGAREIVQFENGILASSIPPVPSLAMTKHAHPRLHRLLEQLLRSVTGKEWKIVNPLWQMTKRQAVAAMRRKLGVKRAAELESVTQSCWNLSAPHVFGVRTFDRQTKHVNEQCGVCIPCIIRRTALPREDFAFDLNRPAVRNHSSLGVHFLEYAEFVLAIRAAIGQAGLRHILPAEALNLIDGGWTDLKLLDTLLRRFAQEFVDTFELKT
jgi:7-cyano-7-deazaguanine synthase in queuosine biosynthesis